PTFQERRPEPVQQAPRFTAPPSVQAPQQRFVPPPPAPVPQQHFNPPPPAPVPQQHFNPPPAPAPASPPARMQQPGRQETPRLNRGDQRRN
ncbi:MAG TPA: hypothetical protein VI653_01660, partial [Steroidobacteraceae bacterium]